jgi:hypothetical protein
MLGWLPKTIKGQNLEIPRGFASYHKLTDQSSKSTILSSLPFLSLLPVFHGKLNNFFCFAIIVKKQKSL